LMDIPKSGNGYLPYPVGPTEPTELPGYPTQPIRFPSNAFNAAAQQNGLRP
jgi:hypothetical protein